MLEKEKKTLAMRLWEFHLRNKMRKIQEIDERLNCFKVKSPTSYKETLNNMKVKRSRLNNAAPMSSSSASKSTADSILPSVMV